MINAHSLGGRLAALVASALLVGSSVAGIALLELRSTINGYEHLLGTDVQDRADARRMQVTFKKQVQEWKDILIRGDDSASLRKYTTAFRARSHDVDSMAAILARRIVDTVSRDALTSFARAHHTMSARYDSALVTFEASGGRAMHESDRMVKGQDRAPTDLIDSLVQHLDRRVAGERITRRRHASLALAWLVGLLALGTAVLLMVLIWLGRAMIAPLRSLEQAARRVADGDLSTDAVGEIARSHDDEIGRLAAAFETMVASLRMVLTSVDHSANAFEANAQALADGTAHLSATTAQLAGAAESVADGATQQTMVMEAVVAAASQVATATAEVSQQAGNALAATDRASARAIDGARSASLALARLGEISEAAGQAARDVDALSKTSERIGEITGGVEQIARQTNLLALNAAIEAARAGEYGRGFAVIANEVRSLADESGRALKLIHALVDDIHLASQQVAHRVQVVALSVTQGEQVIRASSDSLVRIVEDMTGSRAAAADIGAGADRLLVQSSVLSRELQSVATAADGHAATAQQMSAVTRQQSGSTRSLAEVGQRMSALAVNLRGTLDSFAHAAAPSDPPALNPSPSARVPVARRARVRAAGAVM